ncbi:hypothetical protein [Marispirochaeta sp.]|uniref:hypothetical protein n=1 Tax=Marispirochaeta sp. TaxID=2038653 RepID=UPI0029C7E7D7|nr:hypothetical protein [Marispirochaeta sp.]
MLFLYFLFLSSGFAGIIMITVLWRRLGHLFLGWIAAVLATFTVWLLISAVIYYIEHIVHFSTGRFLGPFNLLMGTLAYIFLLCARLSSPVPIKKAEFIIALSPMLLYYLLLVLGGTAVPAIFTLAKTHPLPFMVLNVAAGSIFVFYIGRGFLQAAGNVQQETASFILRWYGFSLLIFGAAILVLSLGLALLGIQAGPVVMLEFFFFFLLNMVTVTAFIRYLMRPNAFVVSRTVGMDNLQSAKIPENWIKFRQDNRFECNSWIFKGLS